MKYPKWSGIYRFDNPHFRTMMARMNFRTLLGRRMARAFRDCVCDKPELPIPLSAMRDTTCGEDARLTPEYVWEFLPYRSRMVEEVPRVVFTIPPHIDETLETLPRSIDPSTAVGGIVSWGGTTWVVVGNDPRYEGIFVLMHSSYVKQDL